MIRMNKLTNSYLFFKKLINKNHGYMNNKEFIKPQNVEVLTVTGFAGADYLQGKLPTCNFKENLLLI